MICNLEMLVRFRQEAPVKIIMFKEIKITENDFIKLLEFSNNNCYYYCNHQELVFIHTLQDCKDFEFGYILDEISDAYAISKVVYDFIKHCGKYNGFLKERIVDGIEYVEIVIKNNPEFIYDLVKTFQKFGFEKTFHELYSNILVHIGFKRGNLIKQQYLYYIEDRGCKPKIERDGIIINDNLFYTNRKFFYKNPLSKQECKNIAEKENNFSCFGCILYKIDLSKCKDIEYYYSVDDDNDMVFITKDIPKTTITIEKIIKPDDKEIR